MLSFQPTSLLFNAPAKDLDCSAENLVSAATAAAESAVVGTVASDLSIEMADCSCWSWFWMAVMSSAAPCDSWLQLSLESSSSCTCQDKSAVQYRTVKQSTVES